jgi:GTP-binding protein
MKLDPKIFRKEINFVAGAAKISQLPRYHLTQIAFIGKSNVGKSSLINAITGRRDLARTSKTPGRTQQINFFNLSDHFILVDLPGYGYAKVSKTERANWDQIISHYLFNTNTLKLINVLIDSRRGIKEHDTEVLDMMYEADLNIQIILTKADEIKNHEELVQEISNFTQTRYQKQINIILTSTRKNMGIQEVQKSILENLS